MYIKSYVVYLKLIQGYVSVYLSETGEKKRLWQQDKEIEKSQVL